METTAKVDIRKLQLLNDRINATLEALNQVRLSVHGLAQTFGGAQGFQNQGWGQGVPNQGWGQAVNAQGWGQGINPQVQGQGFGGQGFGPQTFGYGVTPPHPMAQGLQHSTGVAQGYGMVPYGIPGVFGNAGYGVQGQGFAPQGFAPQGFGPQGFGPQGLGGITPWMQGGGLSHTDGLDRDNLARQMMGNPWLATFPYAQWNATPYGW